MTFASPNLLWLLLVIPPGLLLFFWWAARERRRLMTQFIAARLLPNLLSGLSPARERLRSGLFTTGIACLIVALAGPRLGYELEEVRQRGIDIVVAIDTSKSMLAEDIAPDRLTRAKYAALDLMQQARTDRMGLVAFAGSAFLQCPLTFDDSAFRQSVNLLDVNTLPQGGTALAEAIDAALGAFKEGDNHKILVLFSDGEDHDSGAVHAARSAAEKGLRIFTIGVGSADGELLRIRSADGQTEYVRDSNGNVVKSRLNEGLLQEMAQVGGGFYMPLRGAQVIETLYANGLAHLPKTETQERWVRRPKLRYHWPLALGLLLLTVEFCVRERRAESRKTSSRSPMRNAATTALILVALFPLRLDASPAAALRDYEAGRYTEALKLFEQELEKRPEDARLQFNAGASAYRGGNFQQASNRFHQVLTAPDLSLQQRAYYNLGNTLYQMGDRAPDPQRRIAHWEEALKRYSSAMRLNESDPDAKFNHDFVKQQLEELKQQQQQQQQSGGEDQQNDQQQDGENSQNQPEGQKDSQEQNQPAGQDQENQQREQGQQNATESQQSRAAEQRQQEQGDQESAAEQSGQPQPGQEDKDQRAQQSGGDEREQNNDAEAQAAGEQGEMTAQQAIQLLERHKESEQLLPIRPDAEARERTGPVRDW